MIFNFRQMGKLFNEQILLAKLRNRLAPSGAHVSLWHGAGSSQRAGFHRTELGLGLAVASHASSEETGALVHRLGAAAKVLQLCQPGTRGVVDLSDGEDCAAGIVSMCANNPQSILIPDYDFIQNNGYASLKAMAAGARPFGDRQDIVLWRGTTTGRGMISAADMDSETPGLLPRTRMCLLLKDVAGCDAKFNKVVQSADVDADRARLSAVGILGPHISPHFWMGVRYHICIDGNSLAWSSTFMRLIMGCCLLKPDSEGGYQQWYSTRFQPWQHYVPVAADLSNLIDRITWCRENADESARIAARGQAFAHALDYESEMTAAARRISEAYTKGQLTASPSIAGPLLRNL